MNTNTCVISATSVGMAMISLTEIQSLTYIIIAIISLILTIVTAFMNYKSSGKTSSTDLENITHKLDNLADHLDTKEDTENGDKSK